MFARMAGVSRAAVCTKIKNGTLILNSGGKLDTDNPVNRAYLDQKKAAIKTNLETQQLEAQALQQPQNSNVRNDSAAAGSGEAGKTTQTQGAAKEALDMTVRELIIKHGSLENVERYSKILQNLTIADERDQKIQERRLLQIPKDFVISRLFNFEDQLMNKLLDVPESICDQVIAIAMASTDTKRQDIINLISDHLSRCIAGSKEHIINELNSLKGKYDKQETAVSDAMQDLSDKIDILKEG